MATKWVSSSARGGDNGSDYANAWGDVNDAWAWLDASGTTNDAINLVNDGIHTLPTSATQISNGLTGTNYDTDPGFIVRGVDSSGNPDTVTMQAQAGLGSQFISLRGGARFVAVDGVIWDHSTADPTQGTSIVRMRDATAGPARVQEFEFIGYNDNDADTGKGVRRMFDNPGGVSPIDWGEAAYGIFRNCYGVFDVGSPTTVKNIVHHCVYWIKGEWVETFSALSSFHYNDNDSNTIGWYNNTLYAEIDDDVAAVVSYPANGTDAGDVDFHSNVLWIESSSASGTVITEVFGGTGGGSLVNEPTGDIGYNVLYTGPSIASGKVASFYQDPWEDSEDPKTTDNVAYEVTASTLFNVPGSSWTWPNVNGSGYNLTVPGDLRILLHLTGGLGSTLPGALPGAMPPQTEKTIATGSQTEKTIATGTQTEKYIQ